MDDFTNPGKWPSELRRALDQIPSLDVATKEREAAEETKRTRKPKTPRPASVQASWYEEPGYSKR